MKTLLRNCNKKSRFAANALVSERLFIELPDKQFILNRLRRVSAAHEPDKEYAKLDDFSMLMFEQILSLNKACSLPFGYFQPPLPLASAEALTKGRLY